MKLTDGERLIVVMLADLMEATKVRGEVDPSIVKTLACGGDDWAIKRKYSGIFPVENPSPDVVSETTNILWMWGIIEHSLGKLEGSEAKEADGWGNTSFMGFDANNDAHYGVAFTMINHLGEFGELSRRPLNSHSQVSLPTYRRMYSKFERYVSAGKASPLPFEALRDICN